MNKTNLGAEGLVCSLMLAFLISSCHLSSVQYLFSISLKVSSSWPETALIFNFSLMISSSSSSILRCSLLMFISAYSERESDCLSLIWICLIWSWYFSSLLLAFSSDTSRAFWFSPMAASSSSMTTTRASAFFTLSSARLSSSSIMARERARLSYFISFSLAILLASLRLMSISSISTSLFIVFDSQCLHDFTMLSASFDMCASFITVVASFSTEMRDSSSRRRTLRFWAFTSSSLSLKSFSASSILAAESWSFSMISSMEVSNFCTFLPMSRIIFSYSSLSLLLSFVLSSYSLIFL